jgi:hypothetical protein
MRRELHPHSTAQADCALFASCEALEPAYYTNAASQGLSRIRDG